jgi:xylulokinase
MAARLNLPTGIPVICGSGDQQAQAVGNGIIQPGAVSATIGTGGQLFAVADSYHPDPHLRLHTFCHAVPGRWHWLAATLTAGLSLRWLRDQVLCSKFSYKQLADAAQRVQAGAEGLIYLPYLVGERMRPYTRGVFFGLTLHHTWQHMARAVMEGVVFSLLDGLELVHQRREVKQVLASGGGTRHPLWLQLQANIFGRPVLCTQTREAAALGAALLAGVGVTLYPDLESACQLAVRWYKKVIYPHPATRAQYQELADRYRALHQTLIPHFQVN